MTYPEETVQDAVLTLIRLSLPGRTIYDGLVPETPEFKYVAYYPSNGLVTGSGITGKSDEGLFDFQVTSVASGDGNLRQEVLYLSAMVRDYLLDRIIVSSDWKCSPIRHVLSTKPQRDEAVADRKTLFVADQYQLMAARKSQ